MFHKVICEPHETPQRRWQIQPDCSSVELFDLENFVVGNLICDRLAKGSIGSWRLHCLSSIEGHKVILVVDFSRSEKCRGTHIREWGTAHWQLALQDACQLNSQKTLQRQQHACEHFSALIECYMRHSSRTIRYDTGVESTTGRNICPLECFRCSA